MAEQRRKRIDPGLGIGGQLHLQIPQRQNDRRWTSRLIGYVDGESVLVTTPHDGVSTVPFYVNDEVAVRYMAGREVHGFTTWVKKVSAEPFPYLHLGYPRDIERVPIRKEERVSADLPAKYQSVTEAKEAGEARIVNLSAAGVLLQGPESLGMIGDTVKLQFEIPFADLNHQVEISAVVRNMKSDDRPSLGAPRKLYGLQFPDLEEKDRLFIKGFVYERIIQQPE